MLSNIFNGTTIPVLEQVVNFSQARHNVLAGNIANLDTPGYHVRDLSPKMFQERLKQAIQDRDQRHVQLSPGGSAPAGGQPLANLGTAVNEFLHHDDTNASLESQVTQIAKNELQHNVALSIMTSQFRLLQAAISERV